MRLPNGTLVGLGQASTDLRLYRRVIEIRDALLVLRRRVDGPTVDAARSHVRTMAPARATEPAVVACWLSVALDAEGGPPSAAGWSAALADPVENAWTSEIAFQLQLARLRTQPFVVSFARSVRPGSSPGGELRVRR